MPENILTDYNLCLFSSGKFHGAPDMPVVIWEIERETVQRFAADPAALARYAQQMGFTHAELRAEGGSRIDIMRLIEPLHACEVGVILSLPSAGLSPEIRELLSERFVEGIRTEANAPVSPVSGAYQYKWNAKWTEDTLAYFSEDPLYRSYHHDRLTSGLKSAFSGTFVLPLTGNGPLIDRMPGDDWRKLASLRLLYGYMTACTGKKLLDLPAGWVGQPPRDGPHRWLRDLNTFYRGQPALYELDSDAAGFAWVDANDRERSILAFRRMGRDSQNQVLFLFNFTPVPRQNYRAGVPQRGEWRELLNGDATLYGGSGQGNLGSIVSAPVPMHGYPDSLNLTLPPLAMLALQKASEVDE